MPRPTVSDVRDYLGDTSATDDEIADALAAETASQDRACRVPDDPDYPADLGQALKRRVARNLAARLVPIAQMTTFDGGVSSARVPFRDAEVSRLESPWRRVTVG